MPAPLVEVAPGIVGTPFSRGQTASAAAANTITLAAIAGRRYVITGLVATSTQITVVNGVVTLTNMLNEAGAAGTLSFQFVESATHGGLLALDFPGGLWAQAENLAVVAQIPAIGSGAATALMVRGVVL